MKKLLVLLSTLFIVMSCGKPADKVIKPFFDFDNIVYYKLGIEDKQAYEIILHKDDSFDNQLFYAVYTGDVPRSLNDTLFIPDLEKLGYIKKELPTDKNEKLNRIFSQKYYTDTSGYACDPFYRDIYIFRKKNKIAGIAKLCYQCGISTFIGTNVHTWGFGKNKEFEQLREIVK